MLLPSWSALETVLERYPWAQELAGILPLSALIDFVDVPRRLHTYQLSGATPLWCWPVTPSASRLLVSEKTTDATCCLDRFGRSQGLTCLDGRYGDRYLTANPETVRLCLSTAPRTVIRNTHDNMKRDNVRVHTLEVIRVSRAAPSTTRNVLLNAYTSAGWVLLAGLLAIGVLSESWLMTAFLVVVPLTGLVIRAIFGSSPRQLRISPPSDYNRLVVAASHMNETEWQVFYGESALVNSVLNWPLRSEHHSHTREGHGGSGGSGRVADLDGKSWTGWCWRQALRVLVLAQWALAIGAATTKGWDAYGITFWIVLCIATNTYVFDPEGGARAWMRKHARLRLDVFVTRLSSRRALLNTVLALNPDTFDAAGEGLAPGSLMWIDPVLHAGPSRSRWQEASRLAMLESRNKRGQEPNPSEETVAAAQTEDWRGMYTDYWAREIPEGVEMAEKITTEAGLTGRFVKQTTTKSAEREESVMGTSESCES
ncbi:hypothetical protein LX36DRAFT_651885 [Colletotrichum falcatum]|nr:hypothetical protein LX36DRAFT_651885 [Colletotrichum falcatum]